MPELKLTLVVACALIDADKRVLIAPQRWRWEQAFVRLFGDLRSISSRRGHDRIRFVIAGRTAENATLPGPECGLSEQIW